LFLVVLKNAFMTEIELNQLVVNCRSGDRSAQYRLYEHFYGYALSLCNRYAENLEEAQEVLNDAFFKIFTKLDRYNPDHSFKGWLHRVVVNTAIDRYRSRMNQPRMDSLDRAQHFEVETEVVEKLTQEEIVRMVQHLPPAYRLAFNLFVVEGYSHLEIASMLGITEGASKSNLSKARGKLKQMLQTNSGEIAFRFR
jgi:RNA polymerase sigma factor (sigma-70 family)